MIYTHSSTYLGRNLETNLEIRYFDTIEDAEVYSKEMLISKIKNTIPCICIKCYSSPNMYKINEKSISEICDILTRLTCCEDRVINQVNIFSTEKDKDINAYS